jgi:hypothetical protein
MNKNITSTDLLKILTENICVVDFVKVNGETRSMPCTLRSDIVPPQVIKEGKEPKKTNDSVMNVWCVDKNEWRSFKLENLISLEIKHD